MIRKFLLIATMTAAVTAVTSSPSFAQSNSASSAASAAANAASFANGGVGQQAAWASTAPSYGGAFGLPSAGLTRYGNNFTYGANYGGYAGYSGFNGANTVASTYSTGPSVVGYRYYVWQRPVTRYFRYYLPWRASAQGAVAAGGGAAAASNSSSTFTSTTTQSGSSGAQSTIQQASIPADCQAQCDIACTHNKSYLQHCYNACADLQGNYGNQATYQSDIFPQWLANYRQSLPNPS